MTKGLNNFRIWDELWKSIHISAKGVTTLTSNYAAKSLAVMTSGNQVLWSRSSEKAGRHIPV